MEQIKEQPEPQPEQNELNILRVGAIEIHSLENISALGGYVIELLSNDAVQRYLKVHEMDLKLATYIE